MLNSAQKFIVRHLFLIIILVLIPLAYSNILHAPFVLDDHFIDPQKDVENIRILWIEARHITNLSFALNNSLGWGIAGFHIFNIFLHMLNVILIYYLFYLTLRLPSQQNSMSGILRFIPLFVAAVFALHPIQTNAVTYITQRATVLAAFFCLLSLIFYIKGALSGNNKLSFVVFYPISFVFLLLGLISKEQVIVFPVIILLYDLFFLSSFQWKTIRHRLIFITGISVLIVFIAIFKFNAMETLNNIVSIFARLNTPIPPNFWTATDVFWTVYQHILTEFRVICRYLSLLILPLPSRMVFDFGPSYPISTGLLSPVTTFLSIFFLVSLLALSIRYAKRHPFFSFGILFYFIAISVESFIAIGSDIYFEHRNYLPSIGFFLSISYITLSLIQKSGYHRLSCVLILILLVLPTLTYTRNSTWQSEESLWQDTIQKAPSNKRALFSLGYAYMENGKFTQALDIFKKSLNILPHRESFDLNVYSKLVELYFHLGRKREMLETIRLLEELSSNRDMNLHTAALSFYIGNAYFWYGDMEKSGEFLRNALPSLRNKKNLFSAHILLGQIELRYGNFQQAQRHLELAQSLAPKSPVPLLHLGDLSYLQKDIEGAEGFYRNAIKMDNRYTKAYIQLGRLYMAQGKHDSASDILKKALSIMPDDYSLLVSLGNLSFFQEDIDSAIYYFSRAVEIQPEKPTNYFNLGECYTRKGDTASARTYFLRFLELAPEDAFHDARESAARWLKRHQ